MKVEVTDLSPVKKKMAIEVEADLVAREAREVLRGYARKARIPGFRPGKAPLDVVRKHFGREVDEDVRDRVVARCYHEAAKERGLEPLGDPVLDEVSFEEGEPLRFQTTFEVLPAFELKNYKGVEAHRAAAQVEDKEVEDTLESLRESRTRLVSVPDGAATTGHVVVADVEGTPEDGESFKRERMMIEVGATDNLPAFNEKLEGAHAGAVLEFPVKYPDEYGSAALAGKTVDYRLHVHEVKRKELPELDDEFAKDMGDFADLAALRQRIRDDLTARKRHDAEQRVRQAVLDKVLMENVVVLPDILVEQEIRHRLEDAIRSMILRGIDPEKSQIDWARLRQAQEEPARKGVHARLILDAVAREESIDVGNDEIDARIAEEARRVGETPDALRKRLKKGAGLEALKAQMVREKTLDLLVAVANIQTEE